MMDQTTPSLLSAASSTADLRATLATLHERETDLMSRLDTLLASSDDISRNLNHLDSLRVTLNSQTISTRSIGNTMLSRSTATAGQISDRVRKLDLEKNRVEDTLEVVEQVIVLKASVAGIVGSMGAPQDWEAAASYIFRADKIPSYITQGRFAEAVVPTIEVPDSPWVTIQNARESLCEFFLKQFDSAASEKDEVKVTRFFKLFPLIDKKDIGLDAYGRYIRYGVADTARAILTARMNDNTSHDRFFAANALTRLFEQVAHIIKSHSQLVEQYYGAGQTAKVIKRLQTEVDVQGGIILDIWGEERGVKQKVADVKSYPFSFLAQSLLPQHGGFARPFRVNSPATGGRVSGDSQDEEVDLKELDGLLNEINLMLERWSLYSRFIAHNYADAIIPGNATSALPTVLAESQLAQKISDQLIAPYRSMTAFFFRRSVEKIFQSDEFPSGLSLTKPIRGNPPFILQAVDDVMYITHNVIHKTMTTGNGEVITSVIPIIGRVLESDFIGIIHKRMQAEFYPKPVVQGGFPPEDKIIGFTVLINSLDVANEYLHRITSPMIGLTNDSVDDTGHNTSLKAKFLSDLDASVATNAIKTLDKAFCSKSTTLLEAGLQSLFDEVAKPRIRSILSNSFRDTDYNLSDDGLAEAASLIGEETMLQQVSERFRHAWDSMMQPFSRIMTPRTYDMLLNLEAKHLARLLEKRIWSYSGRINALGAIRIERDFSSIIDIVSQGSYKSRQFFARVTQILMITNMDKEEWEEVQEERTVEEFQLMLSQNEIKKVRELIRQ